MHKTILNLSDSIDIVDETWFLCPWWLRKDFATEVRRSIGPLDDGAAIGKLVDLIDREIDRRLLYTEILGSDRTLRAVLDAVIKLRAQANNKAIGGAKFPVHYSRVLNRKALRTFGYS